MPFVVSDTKLKDESQVWNIHSIAFENTKKYIISISKETSVQIQCVCDNLTSYVTYFDKDMYQDSYDIFCSFLIDQYDVSQFTNMKRLMNKKAYTILSTSTTNIGDSLYFQSEYHIFKMTVKERHYGFYVTVGGESFNGCIELSIDLSTPGSLMQIYSEPECGVDSILQNGETVDMIKASLQMCMILFNTTIFRFSDNSNIECGIRAMSESPPRKIKKPLSLAHLSIIKYGKTWYEYNFNACIEDETQRANYYKGIEHLKDPISMSYSEFARKYRLSNKHKDEFEKYYDGAASWIDFLQCIPKSKHCELTWVTTFINDIMNFKPNFHDWIIQVSYHSSPCHMKFGKLVVLPSKSTNKVSLTKCNASTKKQRHQRGGRTLKNKQIVLSFSNTDSGYYVGTI